MRLERITNRYPADCTQEAEGFDDCSTSEARARFKDFGGQNSTFDVYLSWQDVERAIEQFAAKGTPSAVRVQKAIRLADAVAEISN